MRYLNCQFFAGGWAHCTGSTNNIWGCKYSTWHLVWMWNNIKTYCGRIICLFRHVLIVVFNVFPSFAYAAVWCGQYPQSHQCGLLVSGPWFSHWSHLLWICPRTAAFALFEVSLGFKNGVYILVSRIETSDLTSFPLPSKKIKTIKKKVLKIHPKMKISVTCIYCGFINNCEHLFL